MLKITNAQTRECARDANNIRVTGIIDYNL